MIGHTKESRFIMYDEEFQLLNRIASRLLKEANAKVIYLVDKNGQLITSTGDDGLYDATSLASLTAGNIAASGGLAKLIGEKEFSILFHEGEKDNMHISIVGGRIILVVIFGKKSSLGLVRLRVKKASEDFKEVFEALEEKSKRANEHPEESPLAEITDDDIDNLFN